MLVFKQVEELKKYLSSKQQAGKTIGFVPTMGALHNGHISLINRSKQEVDITVCSIFVNPTQFDDATDLEKYPRTLENDLELLLNAQTEVIFAPTVLEVYPKGLETAVNINLGELATVMEGAFRPGHFEGMMEVVNRLLDIVEPDKLFMGQKDFQQAAIVKEMIKQTKRPTKLVVCPIIRESHGLAMSSRNERLGAEDRETSQILYKSLKHVKNNMATKSIEQLKKEAVKMIEDAGLKPVYFEVSDGNSLSALTEWEDSDYIVACLAAFMGNIRLIDNEIIKFPKV